LNALFLFKSQQSCYNYHKKILPLRRRGGRWGDGMNKMIRQLNRDILEALAARRPGGVLTSG
jgi:hypothetical protein